ncbi:MAG: hypothetical protein SO314_07775 [Alphaproteobacteria bacterium]|nr:hypothetical protein [Alphaproteobacteria bacterium]
MVDNREVICSYYPYFTTYFFLLCKIFPIFSAQEMNKIEIFFKQCLDKDTGFIKKFSPAYTLFSIDGKSCISIDTKRKTFLLIQRENDNIHDSRNLVKIYKFSQLLYVDLKQERGALDMLNLQIVLSLDDMDMPIFEISLFYAQLDDYSESLYNIQWDTAQEWLHRLNIVAHYTDDK